MEEVIYKLKLNDAEEIRFTFSPFNEKDYYHVRTYVRCTMNGEEKWFPTKKGITMTKDVLDEFFLGVLELSRYVKENS